MAANFFWYELMTTDVPAAEAFYKSVVGWNSEPFGGSGMGYIVLKAGDTGVGGLMELPKEAAAAGLKPAWVGYIHAENVDAATENLKKAGGKVHRGPEDIPDVGRFSVVADPQGVMFMLMTPQGEGEPPAAAMTPGHIGWRELYPADWQSAFNFYASQFGWTKGEAMDMGPMGTYQLFHAGTPDPTGGMMTKTSETPHPIWIYYFVMPAIDAAVSRIKEAGGQVLMEPMEVPGGSWVIQAKDPQGAMFALTAAQR